jgi:hypothetical protein
VRYGRVHGRRSKAVRVDKLGICILKKKRRIKIKKEGIIQNISAKQGNYLKIYM